MGPLNQLTKLKLPEIPLPEFCDRKGETLNSFLVCFEGIINKYNLFAYKKYVFLKWQLEGEPLTLVNSLEESKQSYLYAKELLKQAFVVTLPKSTMQ